MASIPINIGRLVMKGRMPLFVPCTPAGCIVLLERSGMQIAGVDGGGPGPQQHRRHPGGRPAQ